MQLREEERAMQEYATGQDREALAAALGWLRRRRLARVRQKLERSSGPSTRSKRQLGQRAGPPNKAY